MIPIVDKITERQALDYEVRSSWWASLIGFKWGQDLAGKYFASKVRRKHKAYLKSKEGERRAIEMILQLEK